MKEQEFDNLNLEDILKEFGNGTTEPIPDDESAADMPVLEDGEQEESAAEAKQAEEKPDEQGDDEEPAEFAEEAESEQEENAEESDEDRAAMAGDTVRLDDLSQVIAETAQAQPVPEENQEDTGFIEMDMPIPPPIVFRPKSRLGELKRQLIAGPEKRYYELSEMGVGKLQMSIFLCLLIVALSIGTGALYAMGMVPENRMRLMIFGQVLAMLFAALLGSFQLIDGVLDLCKGRFTMNTLLVLTFIACCADSIFCFQELRVPICAAFALEMAMSLWGCYHKRTTEMGQMDTMRKAIRLDSVVKCDDLYEGRPGFLRGEGQVADFMDNVNQVSGPERVQNIYALISFLISLGIAIAASVLHSMSLGVLILSTSLLVAMPASSFITLTRPMAVLERRLHALGTVLCGWQGVKGLSKKAVYPLRDGDLFPTGSVKLNGVKFYGDRDPETVIAYAAALIRVNGGGLAPIFEQLLENRSGQHYDVENLQHYNNGGIGGEVCEEPVLMGSQQFLQEMGVEIPQGTMVTQAVYVAIDGELAGLFAMNYARMKYAAAGVVGLCGCRSVKPVVVAKDFVITDSFLREKFGVSTRKVDFPERAVRDAVEACQADAQMPALALTTAEGLAPATYAITGARALRTASALGLAVRMLGGILGLLIMLALAILGNVELLSPLNVLLYQLVWMIPGVLVSWWVRTA